MSKRLPYFQFEPAEYLAGDIMFCSYSAQGIFNTICALYWQKDCDLKYSQVIKRLGNEDLIKELINEKIIKVENDSIIINFLDEQYLKATEKSKVNSSNGSKGALKRWAKNSESNSEIIATPLKNDSESIALREDKIKEDKIKEDEIKIDNKKFVENCLASEQWLETICMQKKITLAKIKILLIEFETHLVLSGDQKKYLEDFKTHFNNWLNKKDLSDNKMKLPKRIVS
jgi:uncharacterized protein YihD (DUF1040 family)